jgi:hypothetical protein
LSGELNSGCVHLVIGALGNYNPDILAMVEEGNQVFAKLPSHGIHQGELLGVQPTGRHVRWHGMPVFTFDGPLIRDLWVLGDLHNLAARLRGVEKGLTGKMWGSTLIERTGLVAPPLCDRQLATSSGRPA